MRDSPLLAVLAGVLGYLGYLRHRAMQAVSQALKLQKELQTLSQHELVEASDRRHLAQLASDSPESIKEVGTTTWLQSARAAIDRARRSMFNRWDGWVDGLGPTAA